VKYTNLEVIDFIISHWRPYKNDRDLLSVLVEYFDQDIVVLGIVDLVALAEGIVDVYFEQYVSDEIDKEIVEYLKKLNYTGAFNCLEKCWFERGY